jgi:hypothetical protein
MMREDADRCGTRCDCLTSGGARDFAVGIILKGREETCLFPATHKSGHLKRVTEFTKGNAGPRAAGRSIHPSLCACGRRQGWRFLLSGKSPKSLPAQAQVPDAGAVYIVGELMEPRYFVWRPFTAREGGRSSARWTLLGTPLPTRSAGILLDARFRGGMTD